MNDEELAAFKSKDSFTLDDFISGANYPREEVTVYFDAKTGNELATVRTKITAEEAKLAADKTIAQDTTELDALRKQYDKLMEKLNETAVVFELKGMPPYMVEAIRAQYMPDAKKDYTDTPEERARDNDLIAKSIIGAHTVAGAPVQMTMTSEYVDKLRDILLGGEFSKIIQKVAHVNMDGSIFYRAVDAGFPG